MLVFRRDAQRLQERLVLGPKGEEGAVAEVGVELNPGQTVIYHWAAEAALDFNIHSHQGEDVTYHERLVQREADGVFGSRGTQDYYLMWENGGKVPVSLHLELRR